MRGIPRMHTEPTFSEHTTIASGLLAEDGTVLPASVAYTGAKGYGAHQPGVDASQSDTGGALKVVHVVALRPGTTLQGMRGHYEMVSEQVYSVHSPAPIVVTGQYFIKLSQLDDQYQQVFSDLDRADNANIPLTASFEGALFRNIFNDRFATSEFLIPSNASKEVQAVLPELVQTVEVVGDDTLNLTYDEWVYLVTGWYPKNNKCMSLGSRARKASLAWTSLLMDGSDDDAPVDAYGKWVARHNFGWAKNLIAIEPCFVVFIAGMWEQPNSSSIYRGPTIASGLKNPDGTDAVKPRGRYKGAAADATVLDRGADYTFNMFRNSRTWLADPSEHDPLGSLGAPPDNSRAGARDAINYWLNGEVRFSRDWDPFVLGVESDKSLIRTREATEGAEKYKMDLNFFVGTSMLQHFLD